MSQSLFLVFALVLAGFAVASEPVVNIPKIAGKVKSEVATVLGKPSSCNASKYGDKVFL